MGNDISVKLNMRGINQLMTSEPVAKDLEARARRIQKVAGDDFVVANSPHKYTARSYVKTRSPAAARREAKAKRLLGALDAGR